MEQGAESRGIWQGSGPQAALGDRVTISRVYGRGAMDAVLWSRMDAVLRITTREPAQLAYGILRLG